MCCQIWLAGNGLMLLFANESLSGKTQWNVFLGVLPDICVLYDSVSSLKKPSFRCIIDDII